MIDGAKGSDGMSGHGGLEGDVSVKSEGVVAVGEAFGKGYLDAVAGVGGGDVSGKKLHDSLDGPTATALRWQMNSLLTGVSTDDTRGVPRGVSITGMLPGWDDPDDMDFFPDTAKNI